MENQRRNSSQYQSVQGDVPPKKVKKQVPQKSVDQYWDKFVTKFPGKVHTILPSNIYAKTKAAKIPEGVIHGQTAVKSYDQARAECIKAVETIARECRRVNLKYRDPHFDIEFDLKMTWMDGRDCLNGLTDREDGRQFDPKSVKRVPDIFEKPVFFVDGATAGDVRQGADGDCWFMAALCALGSQQDLIEKVCVAKDEKVGVYGFVFHRDGEWIQTIIDDKLYLSAPDYEESRDDRRSWNKVERKDSEEEYRKSYQTGSRALYFASCDNDNETWLPLLEKAYAKAHGDYKAIWGGFTGEALEDLTGGVTTELYSTDVLDYDQFWNELRQVNKDFLFGCYTGFFDNWIDDEESERKGIVSTHAYSIMDAKEVKGERLVRVRNPWGYKEWTGAWSDGSEQWTPEWMQLLDHKFGNDGIFWISYKDLMRKYTVFDRTRLFGPEWTVTQQWTSLKVPWSADYNNTKFVIKLNEPSQVVIVLSQLDERYFCGLEGQYRFQLHFRLEKEDEEGYIIRSHGNYLMNRSVSTDLELEAGTYNVLMKISARRYADRLKPEEVVRDCSSRPEKLLQIGLAYDLAHAKGQIKETEEEKKHKGECRKNKIVAERKKQKEELRKTKYKDFIRKQRERARKKRHEEKKNERLRKKKQGRGEAIVIEDNKEDPVAATAGSGSIVGGEASNVTKKASQRASPDMAQAPLTAPKNGMNGSSSETDGFIDVKSGESAMEVSEIKVDQPPSSGSADETKSAESSLEAPKESADETKPLETRAEKDKTAEGKIEDFNKALEALNVSENTALPGQGSASKSPGAAVVTDAEEDSSSNASFDSSIDSVLDLPALDSDDHDSPALDEIEDPAVDEELGKIEDDPWNAVCIVGLRVYSKDPKLSVEIVRPKNGFNNEEDDTPLDMDDPSKGISDERSAEEKKEENEGVE